jgi:hypothetical protein
VHDRGASVGWRVLLRDHTAADADRRGRSAAPPRPVDAVRPVQVGGLARVVGTLQYGVCQIVVALAYTGHYSLHDNYISDLGNTACGPFAVPHGVPDPGVLARARRDEHVVRRHRGAHDRRGATAAADLARRATRHDRRRAVGGRGLGKIVVGLVPENADTGLHLLGAFNIPLSSTAILLLSIAVRRTAPTLAGVGVALAVLGLVGTVLSAADRFAPGLYLGLGVGRSERLAGYPGTSGCWSSGCQPSSGTPPTRQFVHLRRLGTSGSG